MKNDQIVAKNAVLITLLIGSYFLLCKVLEVADNPYLRFLNLAFVFFGVQNAIKESALKNGETNYIHNLGIGIRTAAIAVILSITGIIVYIELINPDFLAVMNNSFLIGGDLSLAEIVISLFIEGMASSFISAFTIMQLYKNPEKIKIKMKA
ncbi:hypothetical protein [uncultured Polaribacter sp.]|uniref:hypothetical protein n=1 Tax=uncultured Polaribacter sp. TaxID=174711 RepID=UPI00260A3DCC|nr:hypothetical protein [uncultured Polaribacter sp.]